MKTSQIFLFALLGCTMTWAQTNTFPTSGDVGIGTTTPSAKLHVVGQDVRFFSNTGANTLEMGRDTNQKILLKAEDNHFFFDWIQDSDENGPHIMYFRNLAEGTSQENDIRFQTSGTSRLVIKDDGDIGIGTTDPGSKLEVNDGDIHVNKSISAGAYRIRFRDYSASFGYDVDGSLIGRDGAFISTQDASKPFFIAPAGTIQYAFRTNGNLGIGTESPSAKLDVTGDVGTMSKIHLTNTSVGSDGGYFDINMGTNDLWAAGLKAYVPTGQPGLDRVYLGLYTTTFEGSLQSRIERMTITDRGNVGIGTTIPDDKLTVKGRIHAEEVKVDLSVPGPDYVFKEGYDLKPLEEVQHYVEQNGHLPNIPSAAEMEENGVELGLMNMKLLEKIEELTLYMIAMNQRMELLEKENLQLKKSR